MPARHCFQLFHLELGRVVLWWEEAARSDGAAKPNRSTMLQPVGHGCVRILDQPPDRPDKLEAPRRGLMMTIQGVLLQAKQLLQLSSQRI